MTLDNVVRRDVDVVAGSGIASGLVSEEASMSLRRGDASEIFARCENPEEDRLFCFLRSLSAEADDDPDWELSQDGTLNLAMSRNTKVRAGSFAIMQEVKLLQRLDDRCDTGVNQRKLNSKETNTM